MKTVQNQAKPVSKQTWRNKVTYVKKNWQLYLFFLMPGLLLTIIFKYLPMGGLLIAFEDYNVIKGVLGSPWVGLEYFRRFLSSPDFMNYLMNTLKLSIYGLLCRVLTVDISIYVFTCEFIVAKCPPINLIRAFGFFLERRFTNSSVIVSTPLIERFSCKL